MEPIYQHEYLVNDAAVDCFGRLKPSMLLFYCQDIAGHHCTHLGTDYDTLAHRNLFWAVIRQKVQITRLPRSGETIRVETWPMPTTRTCYPRSTVAYDREGNELFRAIGLWVLMDMQTRAMILPGKSGVEVDGITLGDELDVPGSLAPAVGENREMRQVRFTDLDVNGHMNNTQYLNWVEDLLPGSHHKEHPAVGFTVCYLNEALEGQNLELSWTLGEDLRVDAKCEDRRIFAAKVHY